MSEKEFCIVCGEDRTLRHENQKVEYTVRKEPITLDLAVTVCSDCGTVLDKGSVDVAELAFEEYRRRKGLLPPSTIRSIRKRYQLSQRSFATLLGMSEATINRYEGGGLQDEAHDQAIRSCRESKAMKDLLERRGDRLSEWQLRKARASLAAEEGEMSLLWDEYELNRRWSMPKELTLQTGFRRFNYKRYATAAVWLCSKLPHITTTSLNKLLFYADFLCYKMDSVSLTGAAYRRLQYGPVPIDYDGLKVQMKRDEIIDTREKCYKNGNVGEEFCLGLKAKSVGDFEDVFSARELVVLNVVFAEFRDAIPSAISDRSHEESAWLETGENEIISYSLAEDLSLSTPPITKP